MIRSMTGYGQGTAERGELRVVVELRAVNHRFCDVRLRLPGSLLSQERMLRKAIQDRVRRGRVEGSVRLERADGAESAGFNRSMLQEVLTAVEGLRARGLQGEVDIASVLTLPGMLRSDAAEVDWDDEADATLRQALDEALTRFDEDRVREGAVLAKDLAQRAAGMRALAGDLGQAVDGLPDRLKERLVERLRQLEGSVELDPQRVAQEAVFLADRADVTEELVRLEGHLEQFARLVAEPGGEPLGKRLEFLVQEIHRETNTINSKAAELELSRVALDLKTETEKVREQIQNLE